MNPPTDPIQLLIYGLGTIFVVLALKLWDRRRDGKLQRTADAAADAASAAAVHAETSSAHAAVAAAAAVAPAPRGATSAQAETILQTGHDTNAMLVQILLRVGGLQEIVSGLPERVDRIERELDAGLLPPSVRRRQDRP